MRALCVALGVAGVLGTGFRAAAPPAAGGTFVLEGAATTGGGTSAGGAFVLTGTAGQADAGTLRGGGFELAGGLHGVLALPTVGGDSTLTVTRSAGGEAVLTWDRDGHVLESRAALGDPAGWQAVVPSPTGRSFTTPADQPARFFRLRKP